MVQPEILSKAVPFRERLLSGYVIDLEAPPVYDESPCWPWQRGGTHGYGQIRKNGKKVMAHRAMFEAFNGEIPEGHEPDHLCHDPAVCKLGDDCPHRACGNPAHMKAVPWPVNRARSNSVPALNALKGCCQVCGREYEIICGSRRCRTCWRDYQNDYQSAYRKRRRAETEPAKIRRWARENGMAVNESGRLSPALRSLYRAATGG